jgi:hypothetical protein
VATSHPRIQVTEDPELARALRSAAPHLPPGLPRSRQVRELAIAGARHLAAEPPSKAEHRAALQKLAEYFDRPETAQWDWDLLRDVKRRQAAIDRTGGQLTHLAPGPSLSDELIAERRAEARAEDRADEAYRQRRAGR